MPARQSNQPLPDTDEGKLLAVYQSKTILGAAILEGGAFANLVAYLLEGQVYSIVLAVLFMLGILRRLSHVPQSARVVRASGAPRAQETRDLKDHR